ncbi:RNA recognition motif, partial [Dermatophagoides farinae]
HAPMDPTESILSTLNYTFDSMNHNFDHTTTPLSSSSLTTSTSNDFGYNDLLLNNIHDVDDFLTADNLLDTINDQLLFPSLNNFDEYYDDDFFSSSSSSSTFGNNNFGNFTGVNGGGINQSSSFKQQHHHQQQQQHMKLPKKSTPTLILKNSNPTKTTKSRYQRSKLSINNCHKNASATAAAAAATTVVAVATTTIAPKVYVSQKSSKKHDNKGTSILVKHQQQQQQQKQRKNSPKKRSSLLFSPMKNNSASAAEPISVLMPKVVQSLFPPSLQQQQQQQQKQLSTKHYGSEFLYHHISLRDHDYCTNTIFVPLTTTTTMTTETISSTNDNGDDAHCKIINETKNEIDDILNGYCPDDVMLKELPECLSDLIGGLDSGDLMNNNTDDLLNHLNDACNIMTEQYLEEALSNQDELKNLPDLNLTEEDLKQVIDSCCYSEDGQQSSTIMTNDDLNDICYDQFVTNPSDNHTIISSSNIDNSDSASVTTGCTDDSLLDDKQQTSSSSFIRLKNQMKSKRNRSLSSSSPSSTMILTKRKRRFSTRSSVNSSDAMSSSESSSSIESSSSRSSSPERSFNLAVNFTPNNNCHNYFYAKNHYNNGGSSSNSNSSSNNNKYQQTIKKKYRIEMNMDKGKQWTKAYSKNILKKQTLPSTMNKNNKCHIIHSVPTIISNKHQQQQNVVNGSSHHDDVNNDNKDDETVLYIGNIPGGGHFTKNDIRFWFNKFGIIEDVQMFQKQTKSFAFVRYRNGQSTANAIKYGNDDLNHPKFILSYGGENRRKHYKDLDSVPEKLDFRININNNNNNNKSIGGGGNDDEDFDTLLRSATESFKDFKQKQQQQQQQRI